MRRIALSLILAACAFSANAQDRTTCSDIGLGNALCRDQQGRTFNTHTDQFGTTVRDSQGHTSHIVQDAFGGGVTIRDQDGSTVHGRSDGFGGTVYRDPTGKETHCRRSPLALPGQTVTDCH